MMTISGLNHTARSLAVYASQCRVTPAPRKTRFRLLARLCRAGLVTRKVPSKGFRLSLPPFPSFPGAPTPRLYTTRYEMASQYPHYGWNQNFVVTKELRQVAPMDKHSNHAALLMEQTT